MQRILPWHVVECIGGEVVKEAELIGELLDVFFRTWYLMNSQRLGLLLVTWLVPLSQILLRTKYSSIPVSCQVYSMISKILDVFHKCCVRVDILDSRIST